MFNAARIAVIGDRELLGGRIAAAIGNDFSFDGEMQRVASLAGVAPGFRVAAGTHHGDTHRGQQIAECGGFSRAEDDADSWESDPERTDELNELAVGEGMLRFVFAGGRPKSGQADSELGFPADALEVFEVGRQSESFEFPVGEAEKRADAGSQRHRQSAAECYAGRGLQNMSTTSLRYNVSPHSQKGE